MLPIWAHGDCQTIQRTDTPRRVATLGAKPKPGTPKSTGFRPNYDNSVSMKAFYDRIEQLPEDHPEALKASEFISNPFLLVAEPMLQHYTAQVKTKCAVVKDTVANFHDTSYIDTLFQLHFDSSTVELYYPLYTKRFLLSYADIKSPNLALKNGIKVGCTRQELLQKLQEYKLFIKEQKNVVEVCDLEQNSWLRFHLTKGKVSSIQYEGYVD
ncbi:hypothetical protein [Rufibacter immobilis]|uniref:hypothetical protein n=1 Tax=Rufibacter immobilis TaxID=1348778 RepID=UPI0011CDA1EA|nr:hypothetical protein [Rufibacter immobilis]